MHGLNSRATDSDKSGDGLRTVARAWATPRASMNENRGQGTRPSLEGGHGDSLGSQAARWGTPLRRDIWGSPEANLAAKANMARPRTQATSLTIQALIWPTPRATDGERSSGSDPDHGEGGPSLRQLAQRMKEAGQTARYPTPKHRDSRNEASQGRRSDPDLSAFLQDRETSGDGDDGPRRADLNPSFVAALMGLPPGWLTPSRPVATASFRRWRQRHSWVWSAPPITRRRRDSGQLSLW